MAPTLSDSLLAPVAHPLIPYLTLGAPTLALSVEAARALVGWGAAAVELGLPALHPEETPALERAHAVARDQTALPEALAALAALSASLPVPVILTLYPEHLDGLAGFLGGEVRPAALLPVGCPWQRLPEVCAHAAARGVELVLTATPQMPARLRERIGRLATGAVYLPRPLTRPALPAEVAEVAGLGRPVMVGGGVEDRAGVERCLDAGARAVAIGGPLAERLEQGLSLRPFWEALLGR